MEDYTNRVDRAGWGWVEEIVEQFQRYQLGNEQDDENERLTSQEAAMDWVIQQPLSIEVRSGWEAVGRRLEAAEFRILLTTGGPAVQITGEIDQHNNPVHEGVRIEVQDWFRPWEPLRISDAQREALCWFCDNFYFGE